MDQISKIFNKKVLGILISFLFIFLIIRQVDIRKSLDALKHVNYLLLLLVIPFYYLSFLARAFRWRIILVDNPSLKIRSLLSSLFIGFTANNLLPARMGEFYRAHIFGKKEDISRTTVFASIILERIFDGMVLFFMLLAFVCILYPKSWLIKLSYGVGVIFIGGFIFLMLMAKTRKVIKYEKFLKTGFLLPGPVEKIIRFMISKFESLSSSFIDGLNIFNHPLLLIETLFLTIFVWFFEGISMFIVIKSFGIPIAFLSVFFVLSVMAFSTMIPAGPAGIGPYQWGYVMGLAILGVSKHISLAASFVNQFLAVLLISLTGLFFIWKDHINIKEIEKESEQGNLNPI